MKRTILEHLYITDQFEPVKCDWCGKVDILHKFEGDQICHKCMEEIEIDIDDSHLTYEERNA